MTPSDNPADKKQHPDTGRYEVQTRTICGGWVNTWMIHHDDGTSEPETFAAKTEAQAAIDEFFADIREDVAAGRLEDGYRREDFRVAKVQAP